MSKLVKRALKRVSWRASERPQFPVTAPEIPNDLEADNGGSAGSTGLYNGFQNELPEVQEAIGKPITLAIIGTGQRGKARRKPLVMLLSDSGRTSIGIRRICPRPSKTMSSCCDCRTTTADSRRICVPPQCARQVHFRIICATPSHFRCPRGRWKPQNRAGGCYLPA